MKYILVLLLLALPLTVIADQYVVEFIVVDGVKKQISSYNIPDGEIPDTTRAYVLVTKEEYEGKLGDGSKWEQATKDWLKIQANVSKVNTAIANKPKTDKEKLAELEAKIIVLESKP